MTQAAQIEAQIELAIKDLTRRHEMAKKRISLVKKKINDLEQSLSQEGRTRTEAKLKKLDALTAKLDRLVDSVISESSRAKQRIEQMKQECRTQALNSAKIADLEAVYKETEQLAKDLLCYSLGHFRNSSYVTR